VTVIVMIVTMIVITTVIVIKPDRRVRPVAGAPLIAHVAMSGLRATLPASHVPYAGCPTLRVLCEGWEPRKCDDWRFRLRPTTRITHPGKERKGGATSVFKVRRVGQPPPQFAGNVSLKLPPALSVLHAGAVIFPVTLIVPIFGASRANCMYPFPPLLSPHLRVFPLTVQVMPVEETTSKTFTPAKFVFIAQDVPEDALTLSTPVKGVLWITLDGKFGLTVSVTEGKVVAANFSCPAGTPFLSWSVVQARNAVSLRAAPRWYEEKNVPVLRTGLKTRSDLLQLMPPLLDETTINSFDVTGSAPE